MTQMTEAKSEEEVKHITKQLLAAVGQKRKINFYAFTTLHNFRNSTCSTAETESSRSYSHKKIRWVIQPIFRWFS